MIGKTLSHYEVLASLGAGGMGEVYRARDTNLKRDVAIKVLPDDLAQDPERLARLEREAHLLASLNHPNIATIFSLEEVEGTRFLVLELIDGESLQQRLARGPLPIEEALDICGQIARALEVAHEAGIVHRDLKPANVLITRDDRAKVLDFGIAKMIRPVGEDDDTVRATELTMAGTLVGTAPYMSPEQVRGEAVDKRSDIWAFGCLFFETLSGAGPFSRETIADTLAAIVGEEPHWESLPAEVSAAVRSLLHRCLQKNPKVRQRDIGDAWVEINQSLTHPGGVPMSLPPTMAGADSPGLHVGVAAGLVLAALAIGAVAGWRVGPEAPPVPTTRYFDFDLPLGGSLPFGSGPTIAISPDGTTIAYVAVGTFGRQLFVHRLDEEGEPVAVDQTEEANYPFFSPDGVWLAFGANGDIEAVHLEGGNTEKLCTECRHGAWADDGSIIVQVTADSADSTWARIPEIRGEMEMLPLPRLDGKALIPYRVDVLPGSRAVLFQQQGDPTTYAASLDTGTVVEVATRASDPYYADGYVLFPRDNTLFAVPFDVATLSPTGPEFVAQLGVNVADGGALHVAVSSNGVLAFAPAPTPGFEGFQLGWVDRTGVWNGIVADDRRVGENPRVSPDGSIALVMGPDPDGVWLFDERTAELVPFMERAQFLVWARDGSSVTALDGGTASDPRRELSIVRRVVASGESETLFSTLFATSHTRVPYSWTPGDDRLLYGVFVGEIRLSTRVLVAAGDGAERDSLLFDDDMRDVTLSHDGQWLSYVSTESGESAVYVRGFPQGEPFRVSSAGGQEPRWGAGDNELFYIADNKLVSAARGPDGEFRASDRDVLFDLTDYPAPGGPGARYDVDPDGNRFLMVRPNSVDDTPKIKVVTNWFEVMARARLASEQR